MLSLPEGEGRIIRQNVINQTLIVEMRDGREIEVPLVQINPEQCDVFGEEQSSSEELFEDDWEDAENTDLNNDSAEADVIRRLRKPD
jgi:hypothetical protein